MDENDLLECLNVSITTGVPPERLHKGKASNAWGRLGKPWKGLLIVALKDKENDGNPSQSRRRGRRNPGRNHDDWIEPIGGLVASNAPHGYRLSAMLVQKARLGEQWKTEWEEELMKVRRLCEEGVHPVWPKLGEKALILAEMQSYPAKEVGIDLDVDVNKWAHSARIDPIIRSELAVWLLSPNPFIINARLNGEIRRMAKLFRSKSGVVKLSESLNELSGDAVLIRVLIGISVGNEGVIEDLMALTGSESGVADVAKDLLALVQLRSGDFNAWVDCHAAEGEDGLSVAMRHQSWIDVPEDVELRTDEIQRGLLALSNQENRNELEWRLVNAYFEEGNIDSALENIPSLNNVDVKHLDCVLNIIENSGDEELIQRLIGGINKIDDAGLQLIVGTECAPLDLRSSAVTELQNRGGDRGSQFEEGALNIFTEMGDAIQIGSILMQMENGATMHPHRTLLVYHLLPGNANEKLCEWVELARSEALEALAKESDGTLSDCSVELVKLLEGAPSNLEEVVQRIAGNRDAIVAFNQVRKAMSEGGDRLVRNNLLNKLQTSIERSSLKGIEERLFSTVLDVLRIEQAKHLLARADPNDTKSARTILDDLIGPNAGKRIVDEYRELIVKYFELGLVSAAFADWHKKHSSSHWRQIVLASVEQQDGNHLASGRYLREACKREESIGRRRQIARFALASFARAAHFSDAVDMLRQQPDNTDDTKELFRLYLKVCDAAQRNNTNGATDLLLDYISRNQDELYLLMPYPESLNLPKQPWQGRVKVALTKQGAGDYRTDGGRLEARFCNLLEDGASLQEIQSVAEEAADNDPIHGLMMFERAMSSGAFSTNQIQRLRRSQNGIFRPHTETIPVKARRKLRHLSLKPLLLIDTNVLIADAKERIARLLGDDGGIHESSHFHRTILAYAKEGRMVLRTPKHVQEIELPKLMADSEATRELFNDVWVSDVDWVEKITDKVVQDIR
ncbi:MAG: hypothetical protein VYB17_04795, partial [Candidatus Thermoplasmatota archaeon]|nr:hypothetical protein [Candidatus Thermoplasmatota archaeon]